MVRFVLKEKEKQLLTECKKLLKENPTLKRRRLHLIKDLEKIPDDRIAELEIPTGVPLFY